MLHNLRLNPSDVFNNYLQEETLRPTVIKGGMALLLSQGISIGLSMMNTLVLARLLVPADFGIIGMITVFINFLILFKDAGLSTATIQKDKISIDQISTLFWINIIISLGLSIMLLVSAPLIASFYRKPELTSVTAVLSVSFVIQGFSIQHNALLQRHLKFVTTAFNEIIAQFSSIITAIIMAYLGFGYWALVGGTLARSMVLVVLVFYFCPWIPSKMKKGTGVRNMMKFGGHLTGSYFIGYLSRNLDSLLIGRLIGAGPLGLYNRAFSLLMQPLTQVSSPLSSLSLPVLSSLKNDPPRYSSYYKQLLDILISLALPFSVYCYLEGEFLIRILLGQNWMGAVPVFKILSVGGMFVAVSSAPGLVMLSHGFSKRYFHLNIVTSSITSLALVIGVFFGITGVAYAYTIASLIRMIPLIVYSFRDTPIKLKMIFEAISGPAVAAAVAGISAYVFIILNSTDKIVMHILTGLIFFILYIALTLLRRRTRKTIKSIIDSVVPK